MSDGPHDPDLVRYYLKEIDDKLERAELFTFSHQLRRIDDKVDNVHRLLMDIREALYSIRNCLAFIALLMVCVWGYPWVKAHWPW